LNTSPENILKYKWYWFNCFLGFTHITF